METFYLETHTPIWHTNDIEKILQKDDKNLQVTRYKENVIKVQTGEKDSKKLIEKFNLEIGDILKENPTLNFQKTSQSQERFDLFKDMKDVSEEELKKIDESKNILEELELPLENIPFYK
jgi:hypothetical protein